MKILVQSRTSSFLMNLFTLGNKIEYTLSAFNNFMLKNFWVFVCWIFGTYLLPVHSVIYIMVFMVSIDMLTGLWKARKKHEEITSKKLGDTIEKMILYMIGIITSYVLQQHIGIEIIKPLWVFGTLIITREYVSIIENIEAITGTKLVAVIRNQINRLLPNSENPENEQTDRDNKENKPE